jgi:universal stress protein A
MKILHPTDFSECAEEAREVALKLAGALGAELILLHVSVETPLYREGLMSARQLTTFFEEVREWAKKTLEERAAHARGMGIPTLAKVVTGTAHQEIVETARQEGVTLIVMGTHGRGGLERILLGSVADRVIRTAPCGVLTLRERTNGAA